MRASPNVKVEARKAAQPSILKKRKEERKEENK